MDAFPMPCKDRISFSLYVDSCFNSVMPIFISARRAGALNKERNPSDGFRVASQAGQVGQSVLPFSSSGSVMFTDFLELFQRLGIRMLEVFNHLIVNVNIHGHGG